MRGDFQKMFLCCATALILEDHEPESEAKSQKDRVAWKDEAHAKWSWTMVLTGQAV